MNIAIPVFHTRVSPRFDCSASALIVSAEPETQQIQQQREIFFAPAMHFSERIKQFSALSIDVVICGGIANEMLDMLYRNDIDVIPWVTGEAGDVLILFLQGRLVPGAMVCPGRRMKRWRLSSQHRWRCGGGGRSRSGR
jgi:predicted Fe-Mo cluster-binding NifX family protein